MLIGPGQLIKQRGFPAVLVAGQGKCQLGSRRQRVFLSLYMVFSALSQAGVRLGLRKGFCFPWGLLPRSISAQGSDLYFFTVRQAQRQFIAMDSQLHWVAHGSILHQCNFRPRDNSHIQKMLSKRTLSPHRDNHAVGANL